MKCIVGLGNPGKKYALTRHNVGFMCLDYFASQKGVTFSMSNKFKGEVAKIKTTILLKPHTFMNLSGESVRAITDYYDINIEDILIVYDDLDLEVGATRLRPKGGSGGHNGIKSLIQHLGSNEFKRVRIGIDKNPMIATSDYVLGQFSKESKSVINETIIKTNDILSDFVENVPYNQIMNKYN